jgi:hypothetical protein
LAFGRIPHPPSSFTHEHDTWHESLGGRAIHGDVSKGLLNPGNSIHSVVESLATYVNSVFSDRVDVHISPVFGDYRYRPSSLGGSNADYWQVSSRILDLCEALSAGTNRVIIRRFGYNQHVYSDFSFEQAHSTYSESIILHYTYACTLFLSDSLACRDQYRVRMQLKTTLGDSLHTSSDPFELGLHTIRSQGVVPSGTITYDRISTDTPWRMSGNPWPRESGTLQFLFGAHPDLLVDRSMGNRELAIPAILRTTDEQKGFRLDRLRRFWSRHESDILSTSLYSSGDAVKRFESSSNFFESLPELPRLLSSALQLTKSLRALTEVLRGNLSWMGELARSLAEDYLFLLYGVAPAISDVHNLSRIIMRDVRAAVFSGISVRGSFSYNFDSSLSQEVGEGRLSLQTHSKVVISDQLSVLAQLLTGLGSVGLKPSLENLWDLRRYSFVADWFTNLSARFQDLDNTMLLGALAPAYYVHSYKLRYESSSEEIRLARLDPDSDPNWQIFARHVSCITPFPRSTLIDFRAPPSLSQRFVAAGALLVVLAT